MDSYVDPLMAAGGSFVTLAKGNRSRVVTTACKKYGGFYLGSIGGPAAILAQNCIKKVSVVCGMCGGGCVKEHAAREIEREITQQSALSLEMNEPTNVYF